jgi:hypothetical protein
MLRSPRIAIADTTIVTQTAARYAARRTHFNVFSMRVPKFNSRVARDGSCCTAKTSVVFRQQSGATAGSVLGGPPRPGHGYST